MLMMAEDARVPGIRTVKAVPDIDAALIGRLDELDAGDVDEDASPESGKLDEILFHGLNRF